MPPNHRTRSGEGPHHDPARAAAFCILECVQNCLREEEWGDALDEFTAIIEAAFDAVASERGNRPPDPRNI